MMIMITMKLMVVDYGLYVFIIAGMMRYHSSR